MSFAVYALPCCSTNNNYYLCVCMQNDTITTTTTTKNQFKLSDQNKTGEKKSQKLFANTYVVFMRAT